MFAQLRQYATLVIAVSGGSDSTALMHLMARWRAPLPKPAPILVIATVDHGLRPGSADETEAVAVAAAELRLAHRTLRWTAPKPATAIQAEARSARYRLLTALAVTFPNPALVTAHTRDDQAETVLMRLARGSGIDGLSGIGASRPAEPPLAVALERPLLGVAKARLVATLRASSIAWSEDPSNRNPDFERTRWRQARSTLDNLGLDSKAIARSAARLRRAAQALATIADAAWHALADTHHGAYTSLDLAMFEAQPSEIRLRLLMRALQACGGAGMPPSLSQSEALLALIGTSSFRRQALAGCLIERGARQIRIYRECGRGLPVLALAPGVTGIWDNRFDVTLADAAGVPGIVSALGSDGLKSAREINASVKLPARIAHALPSFWRHGALIAVPHLGIEGGVRADEQSAESSGFSVRARW